MYKFELQTIFKRFWRVSLNSCSCFTSHWNNWVLYTVIYNFTYVFITITVSFRGGHIHLYAFLILNKSTTSRVLKTSTDWLQFLQNPTIYFQINIFALFRRENLILKQIYDSYWKTGNTNCVCGHKAVTPAL